MLSTACTDPQGTRRIPIESTARVGASWQCEGSGEWDCSSGSSSDSSSEDSRAALSTARASSSAFRAADSKLSTSESCKARREALELSLYNLKGRFYGWALAPTGHWSRGSPATSDG